jgi:PAS domain S-box-containing protein
MTEHRYAILLIDDDPVDRAAMRRYFDEQRLPYEVTDAGSLAEALASIGGHRYDVILSDYLLGEGTGLDVLHRAGGTPVIFVTGHGDEAIAARALRQGAYDYIIKDHDRHYLTALPGAISNSLLRRQAEQALAESERRNRELLENLPSGVYQTTPAGAVLYANPALVRMLRYDSFEGLARINLQQQAMAPAPDRESFFAALDRDGHVANHESIWRARDGQRIVVRESATAVRAADGSVLYYEGWVEDISSRRLAEEKERQYLRELSVLYETTSLLNSMDGIEGIFQYLGEVLRELTNGPYLIICRYEPDDGTIRIHSSWGFEQQLGRVTEALGLEPRTLAIRTDEMTAEELGWFTSGKLMAVPGGLHTLSARRLPRAVCRAVERLLGVRQVQSMGFTIEGRLYGGVVVLLRQGDTIENRPVVETIINQAALAIQRKWAELQLRQSEEFSRTVIEHSPVGITVRDRAGRLLIHNGAWQRICRITDADIPRVRQVDMETIIRSYASWGVDTARVAEVFDRGGTLAFPELRVVDQDDGSVTWISQQIYGITGRDGVVDRVVSLTQDVSERKRADEDLRNNEERFRALLKNSSDIITIVDADQTIRYASPSAGTVLGLAPDAVAGRPLLSLVHPDDVPAVRRTLRRNLSLVGPLPPVECRIRHADGSWRTLEHIAQNLIADPVINGVIINSRDVTERRQADQLQHAIYKLSELTNAAGDMGEFFAGIHRVVAELMYARNFFICLLDPATQQLTYPYFVDEFDLPPQSRRMGRGLTEYIIRHNQPLLAFREHLRKLMDESAVDIQGALPTALLAVPLKTSQATIGALVVQSYADSMFFVERDKEILTYVAQQVAVALERKRTQEALRRSEADLRAVFNSSNQVFILLDLHQKIKSFNSRAADWSQAYCGRALRQDDLIYYYLAPDQADGFTAQINTAKQGRSLAAELPFVRQGEQHWFEAGFNPVHDASGQVYGVCLTLMDIDERRRAVAALARSEERFRAMVQHSSDDIIVVDAAGTITYESTHVLGYDPGALLGTSAYDLVHPDDRPRVMDALQSHLDQPGLIRQIEYRARRADGTWVYLESVGNNLLRDPVVSGIIINSRDISERKQSEALQAALYRIEEITNTAGDLQEFYAAVHRVIEALIYTPNFFIALYDPATRRVSFPYFIDEMDSPPPPRELANGLTDYIITTGEPLFLTGDGAERIQLDKGIATIGSPSVDWLGVPLKSGEQVIGAIVVQSYSGNLRFGTRAQEILTFVSRNIAIALERRRSQESLMRLGLAIESMEESVVITDRDGTIQYVNPAFTKISGYDRGEVVGRNPRAWNSGRQGDGFYREMWAQLAQGRIWQGTLTNRRKDGTLHDEEVTISPVRGDDGETINYVAIERDITERKQAEDLQQALYAIGELTERAESMQEFYREIHGIVQRLMGTGNMYIALYDPASDTMSFPFWEDEHDPPSGPRRLSGGVTDYVIKTGQPFLDSRDELTRHSTLPDLVPFGTQSVEWLGVPLKRREQTIGVLAVQSYSGKLRFGEKGKELLNFVSRHISTALERRTSREALNRLSQAMEQMDESVVITDRDGVIQYVNPRFTAVTGYAADEVRGRTPSLWKSGRHDAEFYRSLWQHLLAGTTWQGYFLNRKKDGTVFEEEATISAVQNADGEIFNFVAITRDVTEKRRLQSIAEAANTMNNIGYVFSGIRHEIGNALNSMKMATSIVQKNLSGWQPEALRKFVDMAMNEVARMEDLLRSLKNFSMYEAPKIQPVDVADFLKKLVMLATGDFKSKGIKINHRCDPDAASAWADPRALHQVMLNLLSNAADALEGRDAKQIDITARRDGALVRIALRDNGCGMSAEQLANLFKPFYTSKSTGTGLGLVITKNIIAKMNGTIEVDSRIGRGTEVVISIPATAPQDAGAAEPAGA